MICCIWTAAGRIYGLSAGAKCRENEGGIKHLEGENTTWIFKLRADAGTHMYREACLVELVFCYNVQMMKLLTQILKLHFLHNNFIKTLQQTNRSATNPQHRHM